MHPLKSMSAQLPTPILSNKTLLAFYESFIMLKSQTLHKLLGKRTKLRGKNCHLSCSGFPSTKWNWNVIQYYFYSTRSFGTVRGVQVTSDNISLQLDRINVSHITQLCWGNALQAAQATSSHRKLQTVIWRNRRTCRSYPSHIINPLINRRQHKQGVWSDKVEP